MADVSALLQAGDIVAGKYRIERLLGTGGMSAVFEATHRLTEKRFAIKWLKPELAARADGVRRFVREAKVAGRVKHPNIIEVYDFGEHAGSFYMVLELLEGESLDDRITRVGRLSPEETCRILLPCSRAVARAHAAGVVHRDLKPANIYLCRATEERPELPKVLDFGISSIANLGVQLESPITESGMLVGTPHYMSPEQVRGRTVDHRSDVYSFGVILYEVLSGETPFESERFSELMVKIATEIPRPLDRVVPAVDGALAQIVRRAMARDPAARYPDMAALAQALHAYAVVAGWAQPETVAVSLPAPAVRDVRFLRPVPIWIAAALTGVLVSAGLLSWLRSSDAAAPAAERRAPQEPAATRAPAPPVAAVDSSALGSASDGRVDGETRSASTPGAAARAAESARDRVERARRASRSEAEPRTSAASATSERRAAGRSEPPASHSLDPDGRSVIVRADADAAKSGGAKPISQSGAKLAVDDFLPEGVTASPARAH